MSCDNVKQRISALLDRRLRLQEQEEVLAHLETCRDCSDRFETMQHLRVEMRRMKQPVIPALLVDRLRNRALEERVRQLSITTRGARFERWASRIVLAFENMMRPLALPFAGGMLSALLLFTLLVPTLSFSHNYTDNLLSTPPFGKVDDWGFASPYLPRLVPPYMPVSGDDTVIELTIDDQGRVRDWSLVRGKETREILDFILYSKFNPATSFGQPTWGKTLAVFSPIPSRKS